MTSNRKLAAAYFRVAIWNGIISIILKKFFSLELLGVFFMTVFILMAIVAIAMWLLSLFEEVNDELP